MYQTKRLSFEETTLSFDIVLFSIWFVERDKEVVFHSKNLIDKKPGTLYSLFRTVKGTAYLITNDNKKLILEKNSLYLIKKDQIKSYYTKTHWAYYCFNFSFKSPIAHIEVEKVYNFSTIPEENSILKELFTLMNIPSELNKHLCNSLFTSLYLRWAKLLSTDIQIPYYSSIVSAMDYIQDTLPNIPSIDSIAKKYGFSPRNFRLIFKQLTGLAPQQYITKLKMEKAVHLLASYDLSITQITNECGYNSLCQFSRDFKKHYQLSPLEYRKANTISTPPRKTKH